MTLTDPSTLPLLGAPAPLPPGYAAEVAEVKRALERWAGDDRFRRRYQEEPAAALAGLGLSCAPEAVDPFVGGAASSPPARATLRYQGFFQEKLALRERYRHLAEPAHPLVARWRRRQIRRLEGQLGGRKAEGIVHAPAALELCRGCSVGCWFCGVGAGRLEEVWPYTPETRARWRETLEALRGVLGECAGQAFCYWATDPLDNPDYERFLADFHGLLGRWPQTTTAAATRDLGRTRRLLEAARRHGSEVDRFSILTRKALEQVHEAFTPEELLRVECIPQNKEASEGHRKATAGRAFDHRQRRAAELASQDYHATIACVSGFLFNMVEGRVRLITPCPASERWPLGYWVLGEARFGPGEPVRPLLEGLIAGCLRGSLGLQDRAAARRDLTVEVDQGGDRPVLTLRSPHLLTRLPGWPEAARLADLLGRGDLTVEAVALRLEAEAGVPLVQTMAALQELFDQGLLDEEPGPP